MLDKIPNQIKEIVQSLEKAGFEAYIVGGCVRDLLMGKVPKDWDVATNARPEEILKIFPDSFYENEFGTVGVKVEKMFPIITDNISIDRGKKKEAIRIAIKYLKKIKCPVHGLEHAENVIKNIHEIAKHYENVNQDILELAGYFHDIGRFKFEDYKHGPESIKIIQEELKNIFNKEDIDLISQIIEHSKNEKSLSLEQEILKEADILDGIGKWRIRKALTEKISHIEWIKKAYQDLVNKIYLKEAFEKMKENVGMTNKFIGINLIMPNEIPVDVVEVTTYRIESKYSDKRHPDKVKFAKTLEEDLSRRDFTTNALALKLQTKNYKLKTDYEIVDLFGGQEDLKNKIIRAVRNPNERFNEDALRMMRAVRFATTLQTQSQKSKVKSQNDSLHKGYSEASNSKLKINDSWIIEKNTLEAIKKNATNLKFISQERIRDELSKIILSDFPAEGIELLQKTGLLAYIIPELEEGIGVGQNRHHIYTIYKHSLMSLKFCPSKKLDVRLSTLLHDIAKPQTKRGEGLYSTFYNHDHVGARVAEKILKRLRFSNDIINKVKLLVDNHMFYYNPDEVSESSVRKLIRKVGLENMKDLIDLRIAERLGSGVPKAKPYKLRHLEYIIDKVSRDAVSVKMLKINGHDLIKILKTKPGPKIGAILDVILAEVVEEPKKNTKEYLEKRVLELEKEDLNKLRDMAKIKIEERKEEDDKELKNKHWVK
jgi:poly(A) polymerase/tRNA nucleotidyltransferase (CCA-adding enzyme)